MKRVLAVVVAIGCGGKSSSHGDAPAGGGDGPQVSDASDGSTYAAYMIVGGLDRVRVAKTIAGGATYFAIDLVQNGTQNSGLTLPSGWGFEMALAMQPGAACNPAYTGAPGQSRQTTSQSGSISWTGSIPSMLDVNATLAFTNPPSWCPTTEGMLATNVAVH